MRPSTTDRLAPAAVGVAAAVVAGILLTAPTAWAEALDPQPGTVEITKKDAGGAFLTGTEFSLLAPSTGPRP
ncbi:hypothetical protein ACFQL8_19260 [Streptomyces goshikiensis]|uniref:hypothetical protein n=1 Tax=Streptomyces goshikiensis TaxID=1942 RepID=UPI0019C0ADCB|nr:hypothetical protein [Streptomyces goshikiensis]GHD79344.1 hypothetical protein GCM10010336_61190 [Streptomyces goshikiensis]